MDNKKYFEELELIKPFVGENLLAKFNRQSYLFDYDFRIELLKKIIEEKKEYALEMCRQTVMNIDRSVEWLDHEEQCKQFIPSELQTEGS